MCGVEVAVGAWWWWRFVQAIFVSIDGEIVGKREFYDEGSAVHTPDIVFPATYSYTRLANGGAT
jgi:hypothetical protein